MLRELTWRQIYNHLDWYDRARDKK